MWLAAATKDMQGSTAFRGGRGALPSVPLPPDHMSSSSAVRQSPATQQAASPVSCCTADLTSFWKPVLELVPWQGRHKIALPLEEMPPGTGGFRIPDSRWLRKASALELCMSTHCTAPDTQTVHPLQRRQSSAKGASKKLPKFWLQ